jgi:hypothetical protein
VPLTGDSSKRYQMIGIPDGLGAQPLKHGNVDLFMNHELVNTAVSKPVVGGPLNRGAFESRYTLDGDAKVLSGTRAYDTAYGYGPSLWVEPVLENGARERDVPLPRGRWIDFWTRERVDGGGEVLSAAPLDRIPVYVREGCVIVTYPAEHVAAGLGDVSEGARPLEATLWGEPRCGRAEARLADGTRVRWHEGDWSVTPERELAVTSA